MLASFVPSRSMSTAPCGNGPCTLGRDNAHKLLDELTSHSQLKIDRLKIPGAQRRHSTAAILAKVGNLILEAAVHVKNLKNPPASENTAPDVPNVQAEPSSKRLRCAL